MARRRRFGVRRSFGSPSRGPSRFAQGRSADGRTKEWISLSANNGYEVLPTALPTNVVVGAETVRFVTLLPANIAAGGEVTLLRIVGDLYVMSRATFAASGIGAFHSSTDTDMMGMSIQLLEGVHGAHGPDSLSMSNTADMDSSKILWRKYYQPGFTNSSVLGPNILAGDASRGVQHPDHTIDIRVKRRFDRSVFQLILNAAAITTGEDEWAISFNFRGLFLTSGGI